MKAICLFAGSAVDVRISMTDMERLLGKKLLGLYFATVEHPNDMFPLKDHVLSAFGNITSYGGGGQLGRVYLALEAVLTDGSLLPTVLIMLENRFQRFPVRRNAQGLLGC